MAQHRLEISELDFENIKGSLKRFLSNQNDLDVTKTTCTRPKQFGLSKIILEGQGITTMLYINF